MESSPSCLLLRVVPVTPGKLTPTVLQTLWSCMASEHVVGVADLLWVIFHLTFMKRLKTVAVSLPATSRGSGLIRSVSRDLMWKDGWTNH